MADGKIEMIVMNKKWKAMSHEEKEELVDIFLDGVKRVILDKDTLQFSYSYYTDDKPDIRDYKYDRISVPYYDEDRIEIRLTRMKMT